MTTLKNGIFYRPPRRGRKIVPRLDRRSAFPKNGSRSAAILNDLKDANASQAEIARKNNCSAANVSRVYQLAVEHGLIQPRENEWTVALGTGNEAEIFEIRQEATSRAMEPKDMVRLIILSVAKKNLFSTVLDQSHGQSEDRK